MILITDQAKAKLREFALAEGLTCTVRIKIIGGGCAGFSYDMCFDEVIGELDEVTTHEDKDGEIKVICDPMSYQYVDGTTVDWNEAQFGAGFKFLNPNTTGSCGCGSSVSF